MNYTKITLANAAALDAVDRMMLDAGYRRPMHTAHCCWYRKGNDRVMFSYSA